MSEEEKKAINNLNFIVVTDVYDNETRINKTEIVNEYNHSVGTVLNLIEKQQAEIEKKDKIIDLTVKELKKQFSRSEPCYLYFEVECKKYKTCEECIKNYFERKVEEE